MANFLLVLDPDPDRRKHAAAAAQQRVGFVPRLRPELLLTPHYALTWAVAPHAPVSRYAAVDARSADCVIFGEPHADTDNIVSAEVLARRHESDWRARNELNGYYCALLVHPERGVRVEGDVLGVFPLYHWQRGEVVLIGSSPGLFRCHPLFDSAVDLHGVAALLLTSGIVGGRTLSRGVRRLRPDHVLFGAPGESVTESAPSGSATGVAPTGLDEAVEEAAHLHRSFLKVALKASRKPGIQLSGGLDSRLLAGFTTSLDHQPTCLTFGRRGDLDARCATQVAHELATPQTLSDVNAADYAEFAQSSVDQEQLSGGLYALPMGWNIATRPPEVEMDRMVCGLTLDAVIGGPKSVAKAGQALSFENLRIGRLGFSRLQLKELIGAPELLRACDEVRDELVQHYLAGGSTDHLREWKMNLEHRHRFAVGACAWRYGLFAWPVMPALDRKLVSLATRLPYSIVKDRQIQTRMLISRFPGLARLELDRNYMDTTPLLGARRSRAYDLRRRLTKVSRRFQAWIGREPRFYVRTMDINSPGWRVVRTKAEGARKAAHGLFRPEGLDRLIPAPQTTLKFEDPIIHSTPVKNTLGLMLWMRQHA